MGLGVGRGALSTECYQAIPSPKPMSGVASIDRTTGAMRHSKLAAVLSVANRGLDLISGEIEPPSLHLLGAALGNAGIRVTRSSSVGQVSSCD